MYYIKPAFRSAYNHRPYSLIGRFDNEIFYHAYNVVVFAVFNYLPNRFFKAHRFNAALVYNSGCAVGGVCFKVNIPAAYNGHASGFNQVAIAGKVVNDGFIVSTLALPAKAPGVAPRLC